MDARDFNLEAPKVEGGKFLEKIYDLQMELINEYTGIERIPSPPINVNTKSSQVLFKDFIGRVVEELSEGYESLELVHDLAQKNNLWQGAKYSIPDLSQAMNHLQNAGEEMADALHFMAELLIYANIMPEDISSYLDNLVQITDDMPISDLRDNVIAKAMIWGGRVIPEYTNGTTHKLDLVELYRELIQEADNVSPLSEEVLYSCGRRYNSSDTQSLYKKMLWDVTHHLNIARNFLKNKPWKQSQMMTNEEAFQESLVKGFIAMMGLFYAMGLDYNSMYIIYFRKNLTNRFRIRSKY